jgi:hypothetical protein
MWDDDDDNDKKKNMVNKEIGWEVMDRIKMARHRVQWRVLVNAVMKLRAPERGVGFLNQLSPV